VNDREAVLLSELEHALLAAIRTSVAQIRGEMPGEQFYAFILYTCPLLQSASFSSNTEESLRRWRGNERDRAIARWSPPDWESHCHYDEDFMQVQAILGALDRIRDFDDPAHRARRWEVFKRVLRTLDAEGVFGTGHDREAALVNIMWGDQDAVAHMLSARELNPMLRSYLDYARSELPGLCRWEEEIRRSCSMYKEEALARIRQTIAQVETDLAREEGR
jgi:hypothetical protein